MLTKPRICTESLLSEAALNLAGTKAASADIHLAHSAVYHRVNGLNVGSPCGPTEVYNGVWDAIINNQANIAIGAPDTLLDGGGIDYTEIGAIRWAFAIAPDHPLAFVPEPIAESQLRLYPNIMVEDTAHTINKKVGWLLHGQESILVPDFNTKCQCQILGEGIGFLPDYMVREAMTQSLLVTRQIHNPRQDSRMLLATQHSATGQVTQWIKKQFAPNGILTGIYQDLLHREN